MKNIQYIIVKYPQNVKNTVDITDGAFTTDLLHLTGSL